MDKEKIITLAIESSCDETSAAVLEGGRTILSNIIATQIPIHRKFGGVVPEIASRKHIINIMPVIDEALSKAGKTLDEVNQVAVTY
ncbi:MAG: tRNA (adenosine(37)-N6)-threonylcarbamoyltransferase complex transferase subunit TsaD, partial [Anaerovibrio sp.]|nr:tRNA (adenosine(37)-N6)-threonylcarbamoyltransferase complex transferase subunit TsaD [Anaerovibrio sp.]